ncbi:hypothetical protein EVJ58_g9139 [Rhodofomes roseus]|uniref:Uncharacterized protein n=1 Tax=Rhodofomes roseus TaxID=34475 RepID=A0A4Y9XV12_9APHY|nr:hypothetical protein EVJ58_g9139 [Rhodofomes roseus]
MKPDLPADGCVAAYRFNIYIHDYCVKHGYIDTAQALMREAGIQDAATPPINAKQGLLFEWWNVFWVLFTAKSQISNHNQGSEDALIYLQHQSTRTQQPTRLPAQPPPNRYPNGVARSGAHMNGTMPNGVGANGVASGAPPTMPNGTAGPPFANAQANGIPGTAAGANGVPTSQPPNVQMMPGGQRMNPGAPGQQPNPAPVCYLLTGPPGIGPSHTPQPGSQQLGRSPSQPASPAPNGVMPSPSPSMSARQPPGMQYGPQMQDNPLNDFLRMPPDAQQRLKQEAKIGDKDLPSLTPEEKVRWYARWSESSTQASYSNA